MPAGIVRQNGAAIRTFRIKQGLKPGELAAKARLSYPHLDNIEHERKQPSMELLHRIAAALDVPVSALLRDGAHAPPGKLGSPFDSATPEAEPGQIAAAS